MAVIDELKILITAEVAKAISDLDKTEKKSNSVTSSFAKMRDAMQGPVAAAGMVIRTFKAIGNEIDQLVAAAAESERATSNLNSVLKATGGAAGMTAPELNALAQEMAALTLNEDEAVTQAEAVMLTFRSIGRDVFPTAIKAAADMAQVMGMDLQSASVTLGKALNEPIQGVQALRRVGVQLTDDQEALVKQFMDINDLASAQGVIMGELKNEFSGAAEAAGLMATGGFLQAKKALGELNEAAGKWIAFNFKGMAENYRAGLEAITSTIDEKLRAQKFGAIITETIKTGNISLGLVKATIDETGASYQDFIDQVTKSRDVITAQQVRTTDSKRLDELNKESTTLTGIIALVQDRAGFEERVAKAAAESAKNQDETNALNKKASEEYAKQQAIITEQLREAKIIEAVTGEKLDNDELSKIYLEAALAAIRNSEGAISGNVGLAKEWLNTAKKLREEYEKIKELAPADGIQEPEKETGPQSFQLGASMLGATFAELGSVETGNTIAALRQIGGEYANISDEQERVLALNKQLAESFATELGGAFEAAGAAMMNGEDGFKAWAQAATGAVASVVEAFAKQWAIEAVAAFIPGPTFNPATGVGLAAAAAGAYAAAGAIRAIPMAEGGSGVVSKPTLFMAGEAGPEQFSFAPMSRSGSSGAGGMVIIQNIGGSVIAERQVKQLALSGVAAAGRGY